MLELGTKHPQTPATMVAAEDAARKRAEHTAAAASTTITLPTTMTRTQIRRRQKKHEIERTKITGQVQHTVTPATAARVVDHAAHSLQLLGCLDRIDARLEQQTVQQQLHFQQQHQQLQQVLDFLGWLPFGFMQLASGMQTAHSSFAFNVGASTFVPEGSVDATRPRRAAAAQTRSTAGTNAHGQPTAAASSASISGQVAGEHDTAAAETTEANAASAVVAAAEAAVTEVAGITGNIRCTAAGNAPCRR